MDSTLSSTEIDPHHDGDIVLLAPKDLASTVEAASRLAQDAARDRRTRMADSEFFRSRVAEPPVETTLHPAAVNNGQVPSNRPSLGRRVAGTFACFLLSALIGVSSTLAWQSYGAAAKQMIAGWVPQLGGLPSQLMTDPATSQPAPVALTEQNTVALSEPASPPQELVHQQVTARDLATLGQSVEQLMVRQEQMTRDIAARELTALQQTVEQLTARQEQMGRDIAKLQMAEEDIRRKIAAPPRPPAASARKPVSTPLPPRRAPQLSSVSTRL